MGKARSIENMPYNRRVVDCGDFMLGESTFVAGKGDRFRSPDDEVQFFDQDVCIMD